MKIETLRLWGEELNRAHWPLYLEVYSNEQNILTLGGKQTETQLRDRFFTNLRRWEDLGHGVCMFFEKSSGAFVGNCGLWKRQVDGQEENEIGYAFLPGYWNKGYATETALKAIRIGFDVFSYKSIVAFTLPTNFASQKVMQKAGMEYEKNILHEGVEHVLYRTWNKQKSFGR